MADTPKALVDHFFRHEYARVVSHFTARYGADHLERIEDAVQEALLKAMKTWSMGGVPEQPTAWVVRTAHNAMLDQLRRQQTFQDKVSVAWANLQEPTVDPTMTLDETLTDDLLRMAFACCHPALTEEQQLLLTLKILCGFSNREVARALLKQEEAVAKGYTRAKQAFRQHKLALEVPLGAQLKDRLDRVLRVLYLLFNEGYTATEGDALLRQDVCAESLRLTQLLLDQPLLRKPQVHGLMALMLFQVSRFEARQDAEGNLLTLEQQDRSLWNATLIEQGHRHLNTATAFGHLHPYIVQAALAGTHAAAPRYEDTDWPQLLRLYDVLLALGSNPIVSLNRAVVLQKVEGPAAALEELRTLEAHPKLQQYHLLYAVQAHAYEELGAWELARQCLDQALSLTQNERERAFLQQKRQSLGES